MPYTKEAVHEAQVNVSKFLESHDTPDIYSQRVKRGKIYPQSSDRPVSDYIVTNNEIGWAELIGFNKIESRLHDMDNGTILAAVWMSPKDPVYYPDRSKIVITIREGDVLTNTSIMTNWTDSMALSIARELGELAGLDSLVFQNIMDIRANPLFIPKNKEIEFSLILKKIVNQRSIEMIQNGEAIKARQRYEVDYLAGRHIIYGNNPRSCPIAMSMENSAFNVFAGEDQYGSLQFECTNVDCKKTITRERGKLVSNCPYCGHDVRC